MAGGIDSGKVTAVPDVKGAQEFGISGQLLEWADRTTSDCARGGSGSSESSSSRRLGAVRVSMLELVPDIDAALVDTGRGW